MVLLETIRCETGKALHLRYHQERLNRSCAQEGLEETFDLDSLITPPKRGVYRCRFLYGSNGYKVEYHPYSPKKISSLKLIHCDDIVYPLKYADRERLNELFEHRGTCDDVLIIKNGYLCDTTIANIALFIGEKWVTPDLPLLEGTTRTRLIETGFLTTAGLCVDDITQASKIAVMNAMMGFIEVENGIIT